MNQVKEALWLFPILFIFHDFEEIIFMKLWANKNKDFLSVKFPKLSKGLLHAGYVTTAAFTLGVAEEFIVICVLTITAYCMY